jgi:hypothetical protein
MNFLVAWLIKNDYKKSENQFFKDYSQKEKKLTAILNFDGFTYYNYSYFDKAD